MGFCINFLEFLSLLILVSEFAARFFFLQVDNSHIASDCIIKSPGLYWFIIYHFCIIP